jgi:acyl carrier protein
VRGDVDQTVIAILSRAVDRDPAQVTPAQPLSALGFGSLDQIECVLALEEAFRVELSEPDVKALKTVQDVIDAVRRAIAAARPVPNR